MTNQTRSTLCTLLLHGTLALSATLVLFNSGHADTKPPELRTLASYPHGSFLENLEVQADGRVLYTDYLKKKIDVLATDEKVSTFSELDLYPISLISIDNGYLVAGHGKSFFAGEDFVKSQKFVVLNKSGEKTSEILAPQAMMLNGMVQLANGMILVADSLTATIWQLDVASQQITPWLQDPTLGIIPDQPGFLPGANGLKLSGEELMISNTSQETLSVVKVDSDGKPQGNLEQFAKVGRIDDFWIRDDGSVLYTTHSDELMLLQADGSVKELLAKGCNGCTAIAPYPLGQDNTFVFINDGGMFEGHKDPVTVVSVTLAGE